MTMSYSIVVNPLILADSGMPRDGVMMATLTNYPFALAPGMGLNAFFVYTIVRFLEWGFRCRELWRPCFSLSRHPFLHFVQIASGGTRQISTTLWVLSLLFLLRYLMT